MSNACGITMLAIIESIFVMERDGGLKSTITLIIWMIITGLFLIQPVIAQNNETGNIVEENILYVRSGPDETFPAVQAVFAGEHLQPFNISESRAWVLIAHPDGTGWIPRAGTQWQIDVETLPVLAAGITPTPVATLTATPFTPTEEPPIGFILLNDGATSAVVRSGPGRGYQMLGELISGELVVPVSRNSDNSWILIRFADEESEFEGFGWLSRVLVSWSDETALLNLPIMLDTGDGLSLTPTLTLTPSPTVTASSTPIPTITLTPSHTPTFTEIPTETLTHTPSPTSTVPTATETPVATATSTTQPSATATTPAPTLTETSEAEDIAAATEQTTSVAQAAAGSSTTPESNATEITITPTETSAPTSTNTPVVTLTPEQTAEVPGISVNPIENTDPPSQETDPIVPIIGGVVGIVVISILLYVGLYAQGAASAARYEDGFVIEHCPVCGRGKLYMEGRVDSLFGIPRPKRTVRCNVCRSVLREKGSQRWTYAVDRIENPIIYRSYNGREISDTKLKDLRKQLPE